MHVIVDFKRPFSRRRASNRFDLLSSIVEYTNSKLAITYDSTKVWNLSFVLYSDINLLRMTMLEESKSSASSWAGALYMLRCFIYESD